MQFIDQTEIFIKSGPGGPGLVSFHAAKFNPKAGADGGDGGHGGSVFLKGDKGLNTLSHLKHRQRYLGQPGSKGGTNNKTGRCGEDLFISVPVGTLARRSDTKDLIGEILCHGQTLLLAAGGKRGLGNQRYLTSRHQAPEENTQGGAGEEFFLSLELKLLADVGLAGFPNAGKSTLLSSISAARPKIANYPFTTLTPQLGVVDINPFDPLNHKSFVMADIPGLIEGASEGKGLGLDFLRHLERTKVLAFVLDPINEEDISIPAQYELLCYELFNFDESLLWRPHFIIVTKRDLNPSEETLAEVYEFFKERELPVAVISAATHLGLEDLKQQLFDMVNKIESPSLVETIAPNALPKLQDFELLPSLQANEYSQHTNKRVADIPSLEQ